VLDTLWDLVNVSNQLDTALIGSRHGVTEDLHICISALKTHNILHNHQIPPVTPHRDLTVRSSLILDPWVPMMVPIKGWGIKIWTSLLLGSLEWVLLGSYHKQKRQHCILIRMACHRFLKSTVTSNKPCACALFDTKNAYMRQMNRLTSLQFLHRAATIKSKKSKFFPVGQTVRLFTLYQLNFFFFYFFFYFFFFY